MRQAETPWGKPLKATEFLVLAVLKAGPLHGYGMVRAIRDKTRGRMEIRAGDLYRVLHRLVERGVIAVDARRSAADLGDERRTYYRLTDLGEEILLAEAEVWAEIATGVVDSRAARPA